MKKVTYFSSKQQGLDFLKNIWSTDEFKQSFDDKGYIFYWCNLLSDKKFSFYETSREEEKSHFSSWWRHVSFRSYENKTIQDLYYLHEIIHAATMPYREGLSFNQWKKKMIKNEVATSIESEVLVYLYLPIREKSFKKEIWFDLLSREDWFFLDNKNIRPKLYKERMKIFKSASDNKTLQEIAYYSKQNDLWADIWKNNYNEVEKRMLNNDLEFFAEAEIPFEKEAKLFYDIYTRGK